jgi:hypothetical protein
MQEVYNELDKHKDGILARADYIVKLRMD